MRWAPVPQVRERHLRLDLSERRDVPGGYLRNPDDDHNFHHDEHHDHDDGPLHVYVQRPIWDSMWLLLRRDDEYFGLCRHLCPGLQRILPLKNRHISMPGGDHDHARLR